MSDRNDTPPDRVLTPTMATSAVDDISTLDPQLEAQPKENYSRIITGNKQETEVQTTFLLTPTTINRLS
jgi:hypothetical protein